MEGWDAIRHCPTALIRSIMRRYNNFMWRNGRFEVACDAPLYCLSDGIPASDWQWLRKQESFRIPEVGFIDGFCAVINPNALDRELEIFCKRRKYFGSALLCELSFAGLNLGASIPLAETEGFSGANCLVVNDLNSYSEEDKAQLSRSSLPILAVGEDVCLPLSPSAKYEGEYLSVALYNFDGALPELDLPSGHSTVIPKKETAHGEIWTEALSYDRMDEAFFIKLCNLLNQAFCVDYTKNCKIKVTSYLSDGEKYLLISNDDHLYTIASINTGESVKNAEAITEYKGYPVRCDGKSISVRIPPSSSIIVKITE